MDRLQAKQIIKDTFESSFDKNRFEWFIKNLLNRIDLAPVTYKGNYIPDTYKQYIKTLERIGKFNDGENNIDILVITLRKNTSKADWRFSLVKMDYKFEQTLTGEIKVKEEFTPARRWSFLVGVNEKSHTAQSRLVPILADDENDPTLAEIEKAFDIETVTKEFFIKYRSLFLRTKEELDKVVEINPEIKTEFNGKGINTVNFAKKLLGQIIFLYFLQKKDEFLDESTVSKKSKLKGEVEDLLVKIFEAKLKTQKADYFNRLKNIENTVLVNKTKRDEYIKQEKEKLYRESGFDLESAEKEFKELIGSRKIKQFFLWKLYFSEVFHEKGGFDIVIANPPYIQLQKMRGDPLQKAYKDENYETHESTGDIYCLFYEQGINLLKPEGHLVFITSNKWMRAGYGKKLRSYFAKYNPLILIDMGPGVFETATVDTSILIIQNQKNRNGLKAAAYSKTDKSLTEYFKQNAVKLKNPGNDAWFIGSEAEHKLKEKIEKIGKPLKEWDVNINYGIKTGFNEAFIIDTPTKERLCREDPKSAEIKRPILRGRDIKRYSYEWAGLWLIATGFDIDIPKLYPAVFKHLFQFRCLSRKLSRIRVPCYAVLWCP
ncbi:MAG: hypothetical protein DRP57_04715, partial [Spirochaetes bacterium]